MKLLRPARVRPAVPPESTDGHLPVGELWCLEDRWWSSGERRRATPTRRMAAALGGASVLLVGSACSASVELGSRSSAGISGPGLEEDVAERVSELSDVSPESVECPEGLDAEVGATATCAMVHDGVRATLAIETTSVAEDGETLDFAWQVEPGSQRLLTAHVADSIAADFTASTGLTLTQLRCPGPELEGTPGAVMTCDASTAGDRSGPVVLTVRGAEGMRVDFGWSLGEPTAS